MQKTKRSASVTNRSRAPGCTGWRVFERSASASLKDCSLPWTARQQRSNCRKQLETIKGFLWKAQRGELAPLFVYHYYITAFSILQEAFHIFGRSHKFPLLLTTPFFVKGEQNYVKPSTNLRHPLQEYLKNKKRLRQPDQGTTASVHGLTRARPPAFVQSIDTMIIAHF